MKVLVDKYRLLTLQCGDDAQMLDGARVRVTHVDFENEKVYIKLDRRTNFIVDADQINAEFQEVKSTFERATEAANDRS